MMSLVGPSLVTLLVFSSGAADPADSEEVAPLPPAPEEKAEPRPPSAAEMLPGVIGSAAGCAVAAGPMAAIGTVTGVVGGAAFLSIFALGFNPIIALLLFGGSACLGIPSFFCLGPGSALSAALGEGVASRMYRDRDPKPAFYSALPIIAVSTLGSCVGFVGLVLIAGAFLGQSPGQARAAAAIMGVGLLSGLTAGPLAAGTALVADVTLGGPLHPTAVGADDAETELDDTVGPSTTGSWGHSAPVQGPALAMTY